MLETHPRLLQIEFLELVHSRALLSAISVATVLLFLSRATLVRSSKFAELDRQSYLVGQSLAWFPGVWAKLAYALNGYGLIYEAFEKTEGKRILKIPLQGQNLYVLPAKYVEELKSVPASVLSSSHAVSDYFLGAYTTLDHSMFGHATWDVVRKYLTQRLGPLVRPLAEECEIAFREEIPLCYDWTAIEIHEHLLQIVGRMTSRVFVGEKLSKDRFWRQTCIDFATCVFQASGILKALPPILRLLGSFLSPHIWRIRLHHVRANRYLIPEIDRRNDGAKEEDMLSWLVSNAGSDGPSGIVKRQLGLSFAAIHTTTNHLTNVLLDLAARWDQYAPELLAEIKQALLEDERGLTKTTVTKLTKLDSFMKESQRLHPPSALSFNRKVMSSMVLSDGIVLPEGCYIAVASGPLARSESYYFHASEFDGFRYHRMRQEAGGSAANANYFTSTGTHSLVFGHGRFACPGRFFASLESKIILVHILLNFTLRLEEGDARPDNSVFADALFPNASGRILFRRREGI